MCSSNDAIVLEHNALVEAFYTNLSYSSLQRTYELMENMRWQPCRPLCLVESSCYVCLAPIHAEAS